MLEIFLFTNRDIDKDVVDFKNKLYETMINDDNKEENSEDDEEIDMSLIDAALADMIFQVACYEDTIYG